MDDLPRRNEQAITRTVGDEVLVYGANGQIHQLNATASYVWSLCDGTRSREQIAAELHQIFDVPGEILMGDVDALIENMRASGLITREAISNT